MGGVCGAISTGVAYDCDNKSTGGLEQAEICLGNICDIDLVNSVINRDPSTGVHNISSLVLLPGAKLYSFEGITGKRILNAGYTIQVGDYLDMVSHNVGVAVYNQCEESLSMMNNFVNGADIFAIVRQKFKGANEDCAFQIYGFHYGLKANELTYNSSENNGIVLLPLSSREPDFEPYLPYNYQEVGGYAATVTYIDSLK